MKIVRTVIIGLVASAFMGCSGESGEEERASFAPETILIELGFSDSLVTEERRLAGYVKTAERVTVLDPDSESEVWGRQLAGSFDLALPLPGGRGVVLVRRPSLRLGTDSGSREFSFADVLASGKAGHLALASESYAFSVAAVGGERFKLVRALGGGAFQETTFESPFGEAGEPPASEEPPTLVTVLGADGTSLIAFRPRDGAFALYRAPAVTETMSTKPRVVCEGTATEDKALFRAIAFDDGLGVFFVGGRNGEVTVVDPQAVDDSGQCPILSTRPKVSLAESPITRITIVDRGEDWGTILVTQASGALHEVRFEKQSETLSIASSHEGVCDYPHSGFALGGDLLGAVCLVVSGNGTDSAVIGFKSASLVVARRDGAKVREHPLDMGASVRAFDVGRKGKGARLVTLGREALGNLVVTDLVTGEVRQKEGIFLEGIFD